MEQSRKNLTLNTLWHSEFGLCIILHTCFANKPSLNFSISLNPIPPFSLASHKCFQVTQWIFLPSLLYPHQNFQIMVSNSLISHFGSLKQLMEYVGMAWITDIINTSLLDWDNNFSFHRWSFFTLAPWCKWNFIFFLYPQGLESPNIFQSFQWEGHQGAVECDPTHLDKCWN